MRQEQVKVSEDLQDLNSNKYIRNLHKIPLLSKKEEYELFKKIEDLEVKIFKGLFVTNPGNIVTFMEMIRKDDFLKTRLVNLGSKKKDLIVEDFKKMLEGKKINPINMIAHLKENRFDFDFLLKEFNITPKFEKILGEIEVLRNKIIIANLRLVVSLAKTYINRGIPYFDLIQEGNIELIKAAKKFQVKKGCRFSTYATWWVRHAITDTIANNSRMIRIPIHMIETINKIIRVSRYLIQVYGKATPELIAEHLKMAIERVKAVHEIIKDPTSMDIYMCEDNKTFFDYVKNLPLEEAKGPTEICITHLSPMEEMVIRLKYGISGQVGNSIVIL